MLPGSSNSYLILGHILIGIQYRDMNYHFLKLHPRFYFSVCVFTCSFTPTCSLIAHYIAFRIVIYTSHCCHSVIKQYLHSFDPVTHVCSLTNLRLIIRFLLCLLCLFCLSVLVSLTSHCSADWNDSRL